MNESHYHLLKNYATCITCNRAKIHFQIPAALAVAILLAATPLAGAAATPWVDAAGGNWSVATNWSKPAVPGAADDWTFGNIGAGFPDTKDVHRAPIYYLCYEWDK